MQINHPASDIAHRASVLGHDRAIVKMEPDLATFSLITTGSHDQVVQLCGRLNADRAGKGGMYLNRRIDDAGNVY